MGLKFNPKEMKLRVPELSYVGHEFSSEGLKSGLEKFRAVHEMTPLLSVTWASSLSTRLRPYKNLSKKMQHLLGEKNPIITTDPVLAYFVNAKETVLSVDTSSKGLNSVILQEGKLLAIGSKTLTVCVRIYANMKLAVVWKAQKLKRY